MTLGRCTVLSAVILAWGLAACNSPDPGALSAKVRNPAAIARQPAPDPGESWNALDEAYSNEAVSSIQAALVKRTGDAKLMKRDAHPKHHGCVKAFFKIDAQALPAQDRVGIFAHDQQEYQAWVRFSNGDPDSTRADAEDDVRGMAIKVMGVSDPTALAQAGAEPETGIHDFVMMNSPVFFIENSEDYAGLMHAVNGSGASLAWFMVTHPTTALVLLHARGMKVGNPLHVDYFSATPYKLGADTMKFTARSCVPVPGRDPKPANPGPDYLKEKLVSTLQANGACFEFLVQKGGPATEMPINDPTESWSERKYPYLKVATLRIPQQTGIDAEPRMNFCENVSFNPWRAALDNRPLGAINRIRLQAYGQINELRHDHNRIPALQPKSHEICQDETAPLCTHP